MSRPRFCVFGPLGVSPYPSRNPNAVCGTEGHLKGDAMKSEQEKNYREQDGCHNCNHCEEGYEGEFYCYLDRRVRHRHSADPVEGYGICDCYEA